MEFIGIAKKITDQGSMVELYKIANKRIQDWKSILETCKAKQKEANNAK